MNRDQIKGTMKDKLGKAQRKIGQGTDSPKQALKGAAKQVEGKLQRAAGDAREDAKDSAKKDRM
jgi:uncharacterized protein YjbJ (UPF0337 family)